MNRKLYGWPALLVLAACQPTGQEAADPPSSQASNGSGTPREAPIASPTGPPAITSSTELIGEYRVAGVNGTSIDLPYGITASIDQQTIHVVADCVNLAWNYEFAADQLSTQRAPIESCARGFNPVEQGIVTAFDSANLVRFMPSNGIEFSGGGHSVLLFSQ